MKDLPLLMCAPMVRSTLAGIKRQTRRIVKPQPSSLDALWPNKSSHASFMDVIRTPESYCRYQVGQKRWVKETFSAHGSLGRDGRKTYRADILDGKEPHGLKWKPSIFMPRWASRITLEVTQVRAERLQDISEEDAIAEGVEREPDPFDSEVYWKNYTFDKHTPRPANGVGVIYGFKDPRKSYATLWNSIHGPGAWDVNPWVFVISFRQLTTQKPV